MRFLYADMLATDAHFYTHAYTQVHSHFTHACAHIYAHVHTHVHTQACWRPMPQITGTQEPVRHCKVCVTPTHALPGFGGVEDTHEPTKNKNPTRPRMKTRPAPNEIPTHWTTLPQSVRYQPLFYCMVLAAKGI